MRLVGQPRLAKHKHTVLVRRTDQLVRDLPRDRFREIDAPNFCCKGLVQGNEFERHVFRLMAAVGLCAVLCARRVWGNRAWLARARQSAIVTPIGSCAGRSA